MDLPIPKAAFVPLLAVGLAIGLTTTTTGLPAGSETASLAGVRDALSGLGGLLGQSATSQATTDTDSAAVTTNAGTIVDAPINAADGIDLAGAQGQRLTIGLPGSGSFDAGEVIAPGVVAYSAGNSTTNAVQANDDGSVRMMTVIDGQDAATRYDYSIDVPGGGVVSLSSTGGAMIFDKNMQPLLSVAAPWAKDATGRTIPTRFETDGGSLTQVVEHKSDGVVYPVVADPHYEWYALSGVVITLDMWETAVIAASSAFLPTVVAAAGTGALASVTLRNKLLWRAGWIQLQSVWFRANDQCLWIWLPYSGEIETGGYDC